MTTGNTNDKNRTSVYQEIEQKVPDVTGLEVINYFKFEVAGGDIVTVKPTANGQSITALIIDPLTDDKQTIITQTVPIRTNSHIASIEASMNQRPRHQYAQMEAVTGDLGTDIPEYTLASIQQATTTLTLVTNFPVDWNIGDWINIYGVNDNRLNYPNFVVATISLDKKTITGTVSDEATIPSLTVGPYNAQGAARTVNQMKGSTDGYGMRFSGTSATSVAYLSKFGNNEAMQSGTFTGSQIVTCASTVPVFTSGATGQVDIKATSKFMVRCDPDGILFHDRAVDSAAVSTVRHFRSGVKPGWQKNLFVRYRAISPKSMTRPIARIISAAKTGTTTATITTDVPHGLNALSFVTIKGLRDQTNFANLTAATKVASIVNTTQFTIVIGTAVTATTYGGSVILANAQVDQPGIIAQAVQSIARDSFGNVTLVGSAAWAGLNIGEYIKLHGGMDNVSGADLGFDGSYEVVTLSTTTLIVKPIIDYKGQTKAPTGGVVTTTNAGGTIILMTTLRSHDTVMSEYQQNIVSIEGQGTQDPTKALPVQVLNPTSNSVVQNTRGTVGAGWYVEPDNVLVADIASVAITTTTTTAAIVPTPVGAASEFNIIVTAVSGTTPTMDVVIQESDDTGTNWYDIYHFPRITATGQYRTPVLMLSGNRIRYVQTIAGTTPSFTRSLNRITHMMVSFPPLRQIIDRAVSITTGNATTATLKTNCAKNVQLVVNIGTATTPPALQIEGSDDNGATWYSIGSPLTATASSTVQLTVTNIQAELIRARVSTAGVTVVAGYVLLKAFG